MQRLEGPADIRELITSAPGARVTIYLTAPTEQGFPDLDAVPLRYRNAVREACRKLEALGASEEVLGEARRALEAVELDLSELARGAWTVAVFQGPGLLRVLGLGTRLADLVYVGRGFALLPLFRALHVQRRYRVLALSTNRVALYEGSATGLERVQAPEVPSSIGEALGERVEAPEDLQLHSTARGGTEPSFHGQGGANEGRMNDVERYHRVLSRAVARHWNGSEPIVLAADKLHQGRFRSWKELPGLLAEGVEGNPDELDERELHQRAWAVVRASVEAEEREVREIIEHARNQGKIVEGLEAVRDQLVQGMVRRLWVREDAHRPGILQGELAALHPPHLDEDLFEELAGRVFEQGGEVLPVNAENLPASAPVVAELRGLAPEGRSTNR